MSLLLRTFLNQAIASNRRTSLLGSLACLALVTTIGYFAPPAQAEGSRELTSSGGDRPFLEFRNDTSTGVRRRSVIKVYANADETINLGSSAVGLGSGTINYRRPDGSTGTCGTTGVITERSQEVAGPLPNSGGYTPCTVTVGATQGGVWEIDFVSPNANSIANPGPLSATATWTQPNSVGYVTAWDVTVRSSGGIAIPGRAFANYFAFNVGNNGRSLSSDFTVLTRDGYIYDIDLNGMDPFGFIFFANNRGFRNSAGNPIYRSLQFVGSNPGTLPSGYSFQDPNAADTVTNITHKIFINPPATSLPTSAPSPSGTTWLLQSPVAPPVPSNFTFTGVEGTTGQAGTNPLGGNFQFGTTTVGSYSITLDLNQNGIYGDGNDRTFTGITVVGNNTVFWDGRDGNGVALPASDTPYGARINLYAGEAHFPFLDAEHNVNGIIIRRVNNPNPATTPNPEPYLIYYDDRNSGSSGSDYSLCATGETGSNCYGTPTNPRSALNGVNSQNGARAFSNTFGDVRGIDTWVYYPSQAVTLNGGVLIRQADLVIAKTDGLTSVPAGSPITYTITVTNNGPSNVTNARVTDTIPAALTNVTWSCAVTSGTGACGTASGTGNTIDTTVNLNNGAVITYIVQGTLSLSASGTLTNTATVQRPTDVTDPNTVNNTATDVTTITTPTTDLSVLKTDNQLTTVPGSPITYTITVTNNGPITLNQITVTDTVPAAVQNPVFTPSTGSYNATTGAWTGLTLATGQSITLSLAGTIAPGAFGTITNTVTVAPPSGVTDSNPGNNTATDTTALYAIAPTTGQIVINEVLYAQTGSTTASSTNDEFIELYNASAVSVDLSGWRLADGNLIANSTDGAGGFNFAFPPGTTLAPGAYAVIWIGENAPDRQATGAAFQTWIGTSAKLNNSGDDIWLYDSQLRIVDYIAYGSGTAINTPPPTSLNLWNAAFQSALAGAPAGQSISLTANGQDGNTSACWEHTTSGQASSRCPNYLPTIDTDPVGNRITSVGVNNNVAPVGTPRLLLIKRITAINGAPISGFVDGVDNPASANYVPASHASDDNDPNWPNPAVYLRGAINGGAVQPGDEMEYTIYFLSNGNAPMTNVTICDLMPANTTFIASAFNGLSPLEAGSLVGTDVGIALALSSNSLPTAPTVYLTNAGDGDRGQFYPAGMPLPANCTGSNTNGAVVVSVVQSPATLPHATAPGSPTNSYGFIRFRVRVN